MENENWQRDKDYEGVYENNLVSKKSKAFRKEDLVIIARKTKTSDSIEVYKHFRDIGKILQEREEINSWGNIDDKIEEIAQNY